MYLLYFLRTQFNQCIQLVMTTLKFRSGIMKPLTVSVDIMLTIMVR